MLVSCRLHKIVAVARLIVKGVNCAGRRGAEAGGSLDADRTSACTRITPGVGGDVVDGVGCYRARVDDDVAGELAVEEGFQVEIEVGLRAGQPSGRCSIIAS